MKTPKTNEKVQKRRGKNFGAVKAVLVRMARHGYRPMWTQLTVTDSDRDRLRRFCKANGNISLREGFKRILDMSGVPPAEHNKMCRGRMSVLLDRFRFAIGMTGDPFVEKIKSGEFDYLIDRWMSENN